MSDVRVREVSVTLDIAEPVGPLAAEDVRKIAMMVIEMIDRRHTAMQQQHKDTRVRDRVWSPDED
jgi:hypothetical protein